MASAIAVEWKSTFAHMSTNKAFAKLFAAVWVTPYDSTSTAPPEHREYAAGQWIMKGRPMHLEFNDSIACFPLKGGHDNDEKEVLRRACDLRPLSMKNTDNKTIGGVLNGAMRSVVASETRRLQRGFVPRRQSIRTARDLDTVARYCGYHQRALALPRLAFSDFVASFPSVIHEWIFIMLGSIQAPIGIANANSVFDLLNSAWLTAGGAREFICIVHHVQSPARMSVFRHSF